MWIVRTYVIGGGQIYKDSFHIVIQHILQGCYSYEADTYISDFDKLEDWRIRDRAWYVYFDICYEFVRYERKGKADEMPNKRKIKRAVAGIIFLSVIAIILSAYGVTNVCFSREKSFKNDVEIWRTFTKHS
ncbi:MAG: hypothetical protein ACLT33_02960 [Lachnospira pectinoschiza]